MFTHALTNANKQINQNNIRYLYKKKKINTIFIETVIIKKFITS